MDMIETKVTFPSNGITLSGILRLPANNKSSSVLPGIVITHPFGGVKEQTASLYANKLTERGFATLVYDAAYQGESEGEPRYLEDPFARAENIKSAVTYLANRPEIDSQKIGALGICAAGGYTPYAAQTDRRIKAVATVSAADMGLLFREGLGGNSPPEVLDQMLVASAEARLAEARGEASRYMNIVPNSPDEITDETPDLYREGSNYYRTTRAQHPNSKNLCLVQSVDRIAQYSSYDLISLISPRPILMIAGTKADTRYFSELAIGKASEPKELFLIEGATHIDLYDKPEYVGPAINKLDTFFANSL